MEQVKAGLVELQLGDKVSVVPNANKPWTFDWQYDEPFFVVGMRLDRGAIDITIAETAGGKDRTDGFNPGDLALVERANPQPAAVDGLVEQVSDMMREVFISGADWGRTRPGHFSDYLADAIKPHLEALTKIKQS